MNRILSFSLVAALAGVACLGVAAAEPTHLGPDGVLVETVAPVIAGRAAMAASLLAMIAYLALAIRRRA